MTASSRERRWLSLEMPAVQTSLLILGCALPRCRYNVRRSSRPMNLPCWDLEEESMETVS